MYFIILQQKSKQQEYIIAGMKHFLKKKIIMALKLVLVIIGIMTF